ncbi:MAG: ABC transporter ATP-binding protein [Thaumarchaeota archaeon]|nr:ABC transporter ATP-binding protein [Nitrososphaerota archaeon]
MTDSILVVENLKKFFPVSGGVIKAVDNVSLEMREGEVLGVVGESGSGKTTLGNMVMGVYPPTEGKILFRGMDITRSVRFRPKEIKQQVQMVFQNPSSSLNPKRTVRQTLEVPLQVHGGNVSIRDRVDDLLAKVDLPLEFSERYPEELGGGEKQLVAIARALATKPSFIVLDEPTSSLDVSIQAKIINVLIRLKDQLKLSYMFITHNLSLMRNVADRVVIMYLGKVREVAATAEFFKNPMHPYTRMLLSSIPVITEAEEAAKPQKIESIGEIAGALNIPPGCSFNPRCPYVMDVCKTVDPPLLEVAPQHFCDCHLYPADYRATLRT